MDELLSLSPTLSPWKVGVKVMPSLQGWLRHGMGTSTLSLPHFLTSDVPLLWVWEALRTGQHLSDGEETMCPSDSKTPAIILPSARPQTADGFLISLNSTLLFFLKVWRQCNRYGLPCSGFLGRLVSLALHRAPELSTAARPGPALWPLLWPSPEPILLQATRCTLP